MGANNWTDEELADCIEKSANRAEKARTQIDSTYKERNVCMEFSFARDIARRLHHKGEVEQAVTRYLNAKDALDKQENCWPDGSPTTEAQNEAAIAEQELRDTLSNPNKTKEEEPFCSNCVGEALSDIEPPKLRQEHTSTTEADMSRVKQVVNGRSPAHYRSWAQQIRSQNGYESVLSAFLDDLASALENTPND